MKILALAPHAGIWVHAFPEAVVLESLKKAGHELTYVTCDKLFSTYCACMSADSLTEFSDDSRKSQICSLCTSNRKLIESSFGLADDSLSLGLAPQEKSALRSKLSQVTRNNFLTFTMNGVPVGKYAAYEVILQYKKNSMQFSDSEWTAYKIALENCAFSLRSFIPLFESHKPHRMIIYSPQYGVNHVCAKYAELAGVSVFFLEAGTNIAERLETMRIWRWNDHKIINPCLAYWDSVGARPLSRLEMTPVTQHFSALIEGSFYGVYSSKKVGGLDVRKRFGIRADRKILVATMSSYDEAFAANVIGLFPDEKVVSDVFVDQVAWIRALIDFLKSRNDLHLIVRVHPRDFPNKRENVLSEQARRLEKEFVSFPENVTINWPSDQVSLYDLAEETSVFLTGWSITGVEMSLLGLPVVVYDSKLPSFPMDLVYSGRSQGEFFRNIQLAIEEGWSAKKIVLAYRWWSMNFNHNIVRLSESINFNRARSIGLFSRLISTIERKYDPQIRKRLDLFMRKRKIAASKKIERLIVEDSDALMALPMPESSVTAKKEMEDLRSEIANLCEQLYRGDKSPARDGTLRRNLYSFLEKDSIL